MNMPTIFKRPDVALLLAIICLGIPTQLIAKPTVVPVEGVSYNIQASMADNLKSLIGKRVSIAIKSGKVMTGVVKEVGEHLLHLEKLQGKEYFDALIRLDSIQAIETRFRTLQR
jgi:small nuclear ribonucleoprotein (snRNP)-like protein